MWNDDILNSSVCNFHKIYPKLVLCFASVFWKLVCFAGFFLNNKTLQHLKLKESYKAILFLLVCFFSFFSNQMRISSISALTDLLSKLLRLLNTTTDLQLHPFSFFNQKFSVNKSKLKSLFSFIAKDGKQQNTSGSKVWWKIWDACILQYEQKEYICMCTYSFIRMHYICVCIFLIYRKNKPLTYLDFFTFYAWRHNLSHAVPAWIRNRAESVLLWASVASSRLIHIMLQGSTLITSKLRWNIFLKLKY